MTDIVYHINSAVVDRTTGRSFFSVVYYYVVVDKSS